MKGDKKGLSTIVATLLIILLVFVAIGLVWVVVRNLVQGGSDSVSLTSKCLDTQVTPTKVNFSAGVYNVTLLRSSGDDEIGGVKLIFSDEEGNSNFIYDVVGNMESLSIKTVPVIVQDVTSPNSVQVVVYFIDSSGNQQLCQTPEELNF
jgi:hypothetical protein